MGESHMTRPVDVGAAVDGLLALYDEHVEDVYGYVLRRCGDVELAEDMTQEAFVAAASRFRDIEEVPSSAWLYQVARSRLIDHWRREARGIAKLRLIGAEAADRGAADLSDAVVSGQDVLTALDEVPAAQRAALVLRYLDDYTVGQVAETLGRSVRATESLLARARRRLELAYKEQDGE